MGDVIKVETLFSFQNGLLSALPYLVAFISALIIGQLADFLRYRGILGTGKVRKLMTSVGRYLSRLTEDDMRICQLCAS